MDEIAPVNGAISANISKYFFINFRKIIIDIDKIPKILFSSYVANVT